MSATGKAQHFAARVQDSAAIHAAARAGYLVNGVLHLLIGFIAIGIAFGSGGEADAGGAMSQVAATPGGSAVLWALLVGLWGLAAFYLLEAALVTGTDKDSWGDRAKAAGKAGAYAAVGATALSFVVGQSGSGDQAKSFSAQLLSTPGGVFVLLAVSGVTLGIGGYFVVKGVTKKFLSDLSVPSGVSGTVTVVIGTVGYIAKGIAIAIVGLLFGWAALSSDPSNAGGLDGALKSLAGLPLGIVALTTVAIGLVSYGVYCFVRAARARL